ncbi:MAG: DUF6378 domain-containing protein [Alphaproteobacteria bacterium]|nr:DUF6378 domain-containing protein [Alphaproteobacteria bacterium]
MNGEQMLQRSLQIFEERRANYGLAKHHFREVARRWSLALGCQVTPQQVVMCLIELKLARLKENPTHLDSIIDIAGYAAVMVEVLPEPDQGGLPDGSK